MNNINQEIKELEAKLTSLKAKAKEQEPTLTLTPISFKNKDVMAKALMDGRTFKTEGGLTLTYDASSSSVYGSPFRTMRDGINKESMQGVWDLYYNLQEINAAPQPWYLNIPKGGIKCYVSDEHPNPSAKSGWVRVVEYDASWTIASFRSRGIGWKLSLIHI